MQHGTFYSFMGFPLCDCLWNIAWDSTNQFMYFRFSDSFFCVISLLIVQWYPQWRNLACFHTKKISGCSIVLNTQGLQIIGEFGNFLKFTSQGDGNAWGVGRIEAMNSWMSFLHTFFHTKLIWLNKEKKLSRLHEILKCDEWGVWLKVWGLEKYAKAGGWGCIFGTQEKTRNKIHIASMAQFLALPCKILLSICMFL